MKSGPPAIAAAIALTTITFMTNSLSGCTPDKAMDFGSTGEITTPPQDELSRQVMTEFDGRSFTLGGNDREAEVRLADWPEGKRITIPFWFGINPLMPSFLRPTLGRIYVMSESILVRPLGDNRYLIRAGSKMFKVDSLFETTHTRYQDSGKILPTVVRFVGTQVITVPKDAPASGTVTEKVPVLREVSLPMRMEYLPKGYSRYEIAPPAAAS